MVIELKDNRRYYLENKEGETRFLIEQKVFNILSKLPNPLTTDNLEGVEYINSSKDRESETLVLKKVEKNGESYFQTGNMIGEFYCKISATIMHKISIGLRFEKENSTHLLEYLLNYANAIYPHKVELSTKEVEKLKTNSIIKILLSNLFSHSISKAHVMGLPAIYQEIYEKDYNIRGRININELITQELPLKGKTPYIKNERIVVASIGTVLLRAIDIIQNSVDSNFPNLSQIKASLRQAGIKRNLNHNHIKESLNHKVLNHPAFHEYRTTLNLARMIIEGFKEPKPQNIKGVFFGYLVDISKIWENYLVKLFKVNFDDNWKPLHEPKLKLFKERPDIYNLTNIMYPDIVLEHKKEKKVMVFDAKFKSSKWFNREDFYKTATYISYYQNHNYKVVLGGQIYPDLDADKINQNLGFLDADADFRFLGLSLVLEKGTNEDEIEFTSHTIKAKEKAFIETIKQAVNNITIPIN